MANARQLQQLQRLCRYIDQHLDQPLSQAQLCDIACCSRFHLHRLFSAVMGISVSRYQQLALLRRASFQLAFEATSITHIGLGAGYSSSEAFARVFRKTFAQSPSQFRQAPDWTHWHSVFVAPTIRHGEDLMQVNVVEFAPRNIAFIAHHGDPTRVLDTASQFINWRRETGLSPITSSETFGIPYHDPDAVAAEDFRFDICGTLVETEIPANAYGVRLGSIPGGRCAVTRHVGSHDNISDTVYRLYREWLPQSGEELRDFPCFFHWLNFVHQVDEWQLLTDIYLPLKARP